MMGHSRRCKSPHDFEVLDTAPPGQDLDVAEEDWTRREGGLRSEGGTLGNRRHQMKEGRYRQTGGTVDDPNVDD